MEELLQKHRTFALAVGVGGFVFLLALMLRGCAFYDRNLETVRTQQQRKAQDLSAPVPDDRYLKELDRLVEVADARVASLSREVGWTTSGEALWDECFGAVLREIGQDSPQERQALMERARRLPSAAFSVLVDKARTVFQARASAADVEIAVSDLGFEAIEEANFSRSLAALAVVARVVGKAIECGVSKIEVIAVASSAGADNPDEPSFLSAQSVFFKVRGDPARLAELLKSVNDRDASGRRLVLDEVRTLGRAETVRAGEPGVLEMNLRVFLVQLEAR